MDKEKFTGNFDDPMKVFGVYLVEKRSGFHGESSEVSDVGTYLWHPSI
jgi:hypothetical protein